jgi:hypothetical protein
MARTVALRRGESGFGIVFAADGRITSFVGAGGPVRPEP